MDEATGHSAKSWWNCSPSAVATKSEGEFRLAKLNPYHRPKEEMSHVKSPAFTKRSELRILG